MHPRFISALSLLALVVACSTPKSRQSASIKEIPVEIVDADNNAASNSTNPDVEFASFPLIQGALAGVTTTSPIIYLPVRPGAATQLPMTKLAELVGPLAKASTVQMKADGLTVVPSTTRLARIGTFFVKSKEEEIKIGGGFADTNTREVLFLVYFSEKCEIRGTVLNSGVRIEVDLNPSNPGLQWLRIVKGAPDVWSLVMADQNTPVSLVISKP